jgi:hypothetical protein
MRSLVLLLLVATLSVASPASAQEQAGTDQWEWIMTEHNAYGWSAYKGFARVEISGGRIHASLRYDDGAYLFAFDVSGSIELGMLGQEYPGIQPGKVSVLVTRDASGITPSEYVGTYRKAIYSERARRGFGVLFDEMIVLSDTVSTLSFYRATRDATPSR